MYQIKINNKVVKEYPHKWQCETWVMAKGYAYASKRKWWIDKAVKIEKI